MALSQADALYRAKLIKQQSIHYHLHLFLLAGNNYNSLSQVRFFLHEMPQQDAPLFIDCLSNQKCISGLVINNTEIGVDEIKYDHENRKIFVNSEYLQLGENYIGVYMSNRYDNDGCGLVSFIDVDEKQYLYSQFEPFHANRVFACFDQPDLKATLQMTVICSNLWKRVLSNEYETSCQQLNQDKVKPLRQNKNKVVSSFYGLVEKQISEGEISLKMIVFPKSKLLPTYLYCVIVGDYEEIALEEEKLYNKIPMSLYSIESLFPHLKKMGPLLFEITIECLKFYEQFFGVPYSFNKYDQAFVHEFKSCAMENAGIVTFNDTYIYQSDVSEEQMLDLANTITHELSHHWFGNLATMKWWDDLWLNQSFAQFISYYALQKIQSSLKTIKYQSAMVAFFARKTWGYEEDQAVTTHPIRGIVPNTSAADSIFDGITYAKGAATLKQLMLLMGEKDFSAALKDYFTKYSFKNATLDDFIDSLQLHFNFKDFSLNDWKHSWLQSPSLNSLQADWDPESNSSQSILIVKQYPYTQIYPTLRPHKILVAFFKEDISFDVKQCLIEAELCTKITYDGSKKYKAIMLNFGDHSFVQIILDKFSRQFFSSNLTLISDVLTRTLIWRIFYDLVESAKITSQEYIEMFLGNIKNEQSDSILEHQFSYVISSIRLYTPENYRQELFDRLFYFTKLFLLEQVNRQDKNQNRILILKQNLIASANNSLAIRTLYQMLTENYDSFGLAEQWQIVVKQFMLKDLVNQHKVQILNKQMQLDKSDKAKQEQQLCRSLLADNQQLQAIFTSYKDPKCSLSVSMKQKSMKGWNYNVLNFKSTETQKHFRKEYFKGISEAAKNLEGDHFLAYLLNLVPFKDEDLKENIRELGEVELIGDKFQKARKKIKKVAQNYEKRLKAFKLFSNSLEA